MTFSFGRQTPAFSSATLGLPILSGQLVGKSARMPDVKTKNHLGKVVSRSCLIIFQQTAGYPHDAVQGQRKNP